MEYGEGSQLNLEFRRRKHGTALRIISDFLVEAAELKGIFATCMDILYS